MFTIGIIKNPTFAMAPTTKRTRTNTRPSPLPPPVLYEEYRSTVRRGFQYFPESIGVLSARDWKQILNYTLSIKVRTSHTIIPVLFLAYVSSTTKSVFSLSLFHLSRP